MELCGDGFSVTNVRRVTERLRRLKGIHLTAHDLLRTFVAIAKHAGVPDDAISMLMNHEKTLAASNDNDYHLYCSDRFLSCAETLLVRAQPRIKPLI